MTQYEPGDRAIIVQDVVFQNELACRVGDIGTVKKILTNCMLQFWPDNPNDFIQSIDGYINLYPDECEPYFEIEVLLDSATVESLL